MKLADKMFSRATKRCPLRSDCRERSDKRFIDSLFKNDWEVFVIKRDNEKGQFSWFTLCCEAASYKEC